MLKEIQWHILSHETLEIQLVKSYLITIYHESVVMLINWEDKRAQYSLI